MAVTFALHPHTVGPAHRSSKGDALRLASPLTHGTAFGETDHAANFPAHHAKNPPKSQIQLRFGQLANNSTQPPSPASLHSIRSAKAALPAASIHRRRSSWRGGTVILWLPQYALVNCRPPAASPPLETFLWRRTVVSFSHGTCILD
jgi:hypothetical protein